MREGGLGPGAGSWPPFFMERLKKFFIVVSLFLSGCSVTANTETMDYVVIERPQATIIFCFPVQENNVYNNNVQDK